MSELTKIKSIPFWELEQGATFRFESERSMPLSGMKRGPWQKTSRFGYVHTEDGMSCEVGDPEVLVLPLEGGGPKIPIYNKDTPERPGLYLGLLHGRDTVDEQLSDWGFDGPVIGPLQYVHTTYGGHVREDLREPVPGRRLGVHGGTGRLPQVRRKILRGLDRLRS